ncbi:squalene/phytoene synthase family protein [Calidifontibacillus oryziterrae]|uniref:squalene/phytoene synthase family protein n=1 Tax=Calidifontibacillus oryziterrae TaxID=1191699 RepID=UPI00030BA143|nr:phytoene/squalene synthase family protein [Calidifontibacillus oryziterrae]
MSDLCRLQTEAMEILKATSRTFFIPISYLSPGLQEAVASAYLGMRAIDEIEDHPELDGTTKNNLLTTLSELLKKPFNENDIQTVLRPYNTILPAVTLRLHDWIKLCPPSILPDILDAISIMAKGMAKWALKEWRIQNEKDLDEYTYYVAGLVGVMLTDIWKWYDNTETDKQLAIAFGRGLQSVNILRNYEEDNDRGVNFFPNDWELADMFSYARRNLGLANEYIKSIKTETIVHFCKIPLALAYSTLDALAAGKEKISRSDVNKIVHQIVKKP